MDKARRGYYAEIGGMDEDTMLTLLHLDIDQEYIFFLEKVNYMFPKAHGVAYLREAIQLMYYKVHHAQAYEKIMLKGSPMA